MQPPQKLHLDLRDGLVVSWEDGRESHYPIPHLRRWSPSAEARKARESLANNPLAVLSSSAKSVDELTAVSIERVGSYAVRIVFNDGHRTGLYSWEWLSQIDPATMKDAPG